MPCQIAAYHLWTLMVLTWLCTSGLSWWNLSNASLISLLNSWASLEDAVCSVMPQIPRQSLSHPSAVLSCLDIRWGVTQDIQAYKHGPRTSRNLSYTFLYSSAKAVAKHRSCNEAVQFIFIIDCQPHTTPYRRWPSFPRRRCTCLEQSARSCHFRTFRSSLPVPA